MARELIFRALCDLCGNPADHLEVRVKINERNTRYLDMCDLCHEDLIAPLLKALDMPIYRKHNPLAGPNRNRHREHGPFLCKVPGCQSTPLKHSGTLWSHLKIYHQMTMLEYKNQYGPLVPMDPQEIEEFSLTVVCGINGCTQSYSTETGTRWPIRALDNHQVAKHGTKVEA